MQAVASSHQRAGSGVSRLSPKSASVASLDDGAKNGKRSLMEQCSISHDEIIFSGRVVEWSIFAFWTEEKTEDDEWQEQKERNERNDRLLPCGSAVARF